MLIKKSSDVQKYIKSLMALQDIKSVEVAKRLDMSKANFSYHLNKKSLTIEDIVAIGDVIGSDIDITFKPKRYKSSHE